MPKLTIIIPVYNEFIALGLKHPTFKHWKAVFGDELQIIVIDSASNDQSYTHLETLKSECLVDTLNLNLEKNQTRSIGLAVRQASAVAQAQVLLILPIDVELSEQNIGQVMQIATLDSSDPTFQWGCFYKKYETSSWLLKVYCRLQNLILTRWLRQAVWTNVFFFSKNLVHLVATEGFLEDVILADRLKKTSAGNVLKSKVLVNVRKYQQDGILKRVFYNGIIILLYRLGYRDFNSLKALYLGKLGLWQLIQASFD